MTTKEIDSEQVDRENELVERVLASFAQTGDARLKLLMEELVRHLHRFIRTVRLTENEWNLAIKFLAEAGKITDDKRQEFVLLSDILGASMQVVTVGNLANKNATESTVFGPFFVEDAPFVENGADISFGAKGEPCYISGHVSDTSGRAIAGARIEIWEADEDGYYDVQYGDDRTTARAHLLSDSEGSFHFWGLTPTPYPIPHDGPVGKLLEAVSRSPMRAAHLHFMVSAPGYRRLVTHIFVRGDRQLEIGDSVFGVKESLIKEFTRYPAGTPTPDSRQLGSERGFSEARFDIVLAPVGTE